LLKNIDLKNKDGKFFKYGEDVTLFIPMAEMAGKNRCFHIKDKLYYYRFHNDNIHQCSKNKERGEQIQGDLSFRVPYKRMKKNN